MEVLILLTFLYSYQMRAVSTVHPPNMYPITLLGLRSTYMDQRQLWRSEMQEGDLQHDHPSVWYHCLSILGHE